MSPHDNLYPGVKIYQRHHCMKYSSATQNDYQLVNIIIIITIVTIVTITIIIIINLQGQTVNSVEDGNNRG